MADKRMGDIQGESTDDKHPIEIDVLSFGAGTEDPIAEVDGESTDDDHRDVVDVPSIDSATAEASFDEVFDSTDLRAVADAAPGLEPIGGYRAEWRPNDADTDDEVFDSTDLRAAGNTSFGAGASDPYIRLTDDIKYRDGATDVFGDGPHDIDIGGSSLDEPTDIPIGPPEPDPGVDPDAGVEMVEAEGGPTAAGGDHFDDVD